MSVSAEQSTASRIRSPQSNPYHTPALRIRFPRWPPSNSLPSKDAPWAFLQSVVLIPEAVPFRFPYGLTKGTSRTWPAWTAGFFEPGHWNIDQISRFFRRDSNLEE